MQNKKNAFSPLTTVTGYTPEELRKIVSERRIIIWGCGFLGKLIKRQIEIMNLEVYSFCDRHPVVHFEGKDVIKVEDALAEAQRKRAFIIIASANYRQELEMKCLSCGLIRGVDFDTYIKIRRPEAAISISGNCRLHCPSCPVQGNAPSVKRCYMSAENFKKIFDKLLREEPLLSQIDISLWGEPLLNPDLPEIIKYSESAGVPIILSTVLLSVTNLEKIIASRPSRLTVSVAGGSKEKYEKYFAGANWEVFLQNFATLNDIAASFEFSSRISVSYQCYLDNMGKDYLTIAQTCKKYGFKLHKLLGFPCEYDRLLKYCSEEDYSLSDTMKDALIWDFDRALQFSLEEGEKPCRCQRIFPIIDWDGSVALCHVFYKPKIADNFFNYPLKELIARRHSAQFCRICQLYGLHRLDPEAQIPQKNGKSLLKKGVKL